MTENESLDKIRINTKASFYDYGSFIFCTINEPLELQGLRASVMLAVGGTAVSGVFLALDLSEQFSTRDTVPQLLVKLEFAMLEMVISGMWHDFMNCMTTLHLTLFL